MKNKTIKFYPNNNIAARVFDYPKPASLCLPEWYKKQEKYMGGDKRYTNGILNHTIKGCMPVFDMITAGYFITLPADVFINVALDGVDSQWSADDIKLIEHHPAEQYNHLVIPNGFFPIGLKFLQPWIIETPPGYSTLFMPPAYRDDVDFQILPAIVDTDKHPEPVNLPFFIKDGFSGLIKQGTPIAQIIPFKRDSWEHKNMEYIDKFYFSWNKARRKMGNVYKTYFRSAKSWK